MRRKRKGKTPGNDLRKLALAGRWDDVRALLKERLARDPHDEEARRELERLQQGLPLRAMDSALVRKRREQQEMREELEALLSLYRNQPDFIDGWDPATLQRRHKRACLIRSTLGKTLPPELEQEASAYIRAMGAKLKRRRGTVRWGLRLGIGLPLVAALIGLPAMALYSQAHRAETQLREALRQHDIPRVQQALHSADSGIYRLFNGKLASIIDQAQRWHTYALQQCRELEQDVTCMETGQGSISALPISQRAEYERLLKHLPAGMEALQLRWKRLCEREERVLAQQREEVEQYFRTPLPPMPELTGDPAADDAALQVQQRDLRKLAREYNDANEIFHLNSELGEALRQRLAAIRELRQDIAALRRTASMLPTARSYAQYRELLEGFKPVRYEPALRMAAIRDRMPDEDKLRDQMQDHGRQLPPGMMEAARRALLQGGPTFPPDFPANITQVQLMEDVFTTTTLQKVLYEMSAQTLPTVITESRPEVSETSVTFRPSPLTPGYTLETPPRITWHNPQSVYIRRIDATGLLPAIGITREEFFRSSNLPSLMDGILRYEQGGCPALARAYVFHRLLEVMRAHEWPTMLGTAYAPTLRADARSFEKLRRELNFPLEAGCWLLSTSGARQAEAAYAHWFHERRHHHYAQDIARNFGALVEVHPSYIGFIDEAGKPRLYREVSANAILWYCAQEGLTTTPRREKPDNPILYSPVFVVEKD